MKAFLVGLLVVLMISVAWVGAVLLLPLILVMGFFFKWVLGLFLILFTIWLIGKITLLMVEQMRKKP
ncbi:MAG: hypothetical protein JW893_08020 [Candidatus Omnitrophica bacterium]|nr:hypothetical protein [Candidatus Omnitrophota bacterium]